MRATLIAVLMVLMFAVTANAADEQGKTYVEIWARCCLWNAPDRVNKVWDGYIKNSEVPVIGETLEFKTFTEKVLAKCSGPWSDIRGAIQSQFIPRVYILESVGSCANLPDRR